MCSWGRSAWCLPPVLYGSIFELLAFAALPFFSSSVVLWDQLGFFLVFEVWVWFLVWYWFLW